MIKKYDDIIHLPHHVSTERAHMPLIDRAAQFSPFAALTGHEDAIKETAKLTDKRIDLDEYMKGDINNRLQIIADRLKEHPKIKITYFQPNGKKDGGSYVTAIGSVRKIDEYERVIIMNDCTVIPIDEIISMDGEIFEAIENHL